MRRLRHPNIIRLYETMKTSTLYCLVTEIAEGGELLSHVRSVGDGWLEEGVPRILLAGDSDGCQLDRMCLVNTVYCLSFSIRNDCKEKRLSEATTRQYIRQLVSALDYLHSAGIVHRYVCTYVYTFVHTYATNDWCNHDS